MTSKIYEDKEKVWISKNCIQQLISFKVKLKPDPQPPSQPDSHTPVHFEEQEEKSKPREQYPRLHFLSINTN